MPDVQEVPVPVSAGRRNRRCTVHQVREEIGFHLCHELHLPDVQKVPGPISAGQRNKRSEVHQVRAGIGIHWSQTTTTAKWDTRQRCANQSTVTIIVFVVTCASYINERQPQAKQTRATVKTTNVKVNFNIKIESQSHSQSQSQSQV